MKDNTASVHAQVPVDVATFLLNEKRVDLQLIEARHRVSVVLIPNVHLETPNYTVVRLRHDDLNRGEPLAASYNLVEIPEEDQEKPVAGASEPAAPRPQAAVRGITPQGPAPLPVVRPEAAEPVRPLAADPSDSSIISKIFGFFRKAPQAPAPADERSAAQPARPVDRGGPRRGRHERPERDGGRRDQGRGDHGGGQRHPRPQGQQSQGQRDGGRGRQDQRQQQQDARRQDGGQQQRQQPPQRERASGEAAARGPAQAGTQQPRDPNEHREGRGRRRRRGRGRHEQREQAGAAGSPPPQDNRDGTTPSLPPATRIEEITAVAIAAASAIPQVEPEPAVPVEVSALEAPHVPMTAQESLALESETPRSEHVPESHAPEVRQFTVPDMPLEEARVLSEPAPISQERSEGSAAPQFDLPSGLEQVESDPAKVRAAEQEPNAEEETRPKRARPVLPPITEESLVQVETGQPEASQTGNRATTTPS